MEKGGRAAPESLLIMSSDRHIPPLAERYREYVDPKYRADFDEWFSEHLPTWLTTHMMAKDSVKGIDVDGIWGSQDQEEFVRGAAEIPWASPAGSQGSEQEKQLQQRLRHNG
jgi:hypothetical protein